MIVSKFLRKQTIFIIMYSNEWVAKWKTWFSYFFIFDSGSNPFVCRCNFGESYHSRSKQKVFDHEHRPYTLTSFLHCSIYLSVKLKGKNCLNQAHQIARQPKWGRKLFYSTFVPFSMIFFLFSTLSKCIQNFGGKLNSKTLSWTLLFYKLKVGAEV